MTTLFFDIRRFAHGCFVLFILSGRCFSGESSTVAAQAAPFEVLAKRIDAAIKNAETNENARRDQDVRSQILGYAVQQVNAMGKLGDHAALPFLEEKSLSTNTYQLIRERTAAAYVKIANLYESVEFMRELYKLDWGGNTWRWPITECFLEKVKHAEDNSLSEETRDAVYAILINQIQNPSNTRESDCIDRFLLARLSEYSGSRQRAVLAQAYANRGNEWMTNTFNPIKEHFDNIPPSKRVDLRARFLGLPPLPEDKADRSFSAITLAVGAAFVAACATILIALKRRKTRNHADRHPDNLR